MHNSTLNNINTDSMNAKDSHQPSYETPCGSEVSEYGDERNAISFEKQQNTEDSFGAKGAYIVDKRTSTWPVSRYRKG